MHFEEDRKCSSRQIVKQLRIFSTYDVVVVKDTESLHLNFQWPVRSSVVFKRGLELSQE